MAKDKTQTLLENKEVFEETLNEFSSKSYDLASVNEIIKRSNFNKGSFYYRFKDKQELYTALLDYVFVIQTDQLKKVGFSLINNDHIDEVLFSMFDNLLQVYQLDQRYYYLIVMFLNESDAFKTMILEGTVPFIYQRFYKKIKMLNVFSKAQLLLVESVYKNMPIDDIKDNEKILKDIVQQILGNQTDVSLVKGEEQVNQAFETYFNMPFNYLLIDEDEAWFKQWFNLLKVAQHEKLLVRKLRFKTLSFLFKPKRILSRYMHKPTFNHSGVQKLIQNDDIYQKIIGDDMLRPLFYALIYAIIDLREFVVIDHILHFLNHEQKDLLFEYILPINGKLTKIVMAENQLILNEESFNHFYVYDQFDGIKKYHVQDFKDKYYLKIFCEYLIDGQYYHVYFNSFNSFLRFYEDNDIELITIKTVKTLNMNQIREVATQ